MAISDNFAACIHEQSYLYVLSSQVECIDVDVLLHFR